MPSKNLSPSARAILSDRFHFGWCNACERYACGQSSEEIVATPTKESSAVTEREARAVTAGVHAAIGVIAGEDRGQAGRIARQYGITEKAFADLFSLTLDV